MRCLISVLATAVLGVSLVADPQEPTFRAGTHTVSLYATVVDADRRLVPSLTKDDFAVFDDGRRQDLTVFRNEVQPITIVVMLDRSSSMLANFDLVRRAAEQFVTDLLPDDRARVGSFSDSVRIDPPEFTSDHDALLHILSERLLEPGGTPLWHATLTAMSALSGYGGRRVVLTFTDGKDLPGQPEIRTSLNDVVDRAQTDGVMVYAIGLASTCDPSVNLDRSGAAGMLFQRRGGGGQGGRRGPSGRGGRIGNRPGPPHGPRIGGGPGVDVVGGGGGRGGDGRGGDGHWGGDGTPVDTSSCTSTGPDPGLKILADESGGGYFELRGTDNLDATFARVADELHYQYVLGFTAASLDGKLHKLEVRVRQPNMTVRARKSYLAAPVK